MLEDLDWQEDGLRCFLREENADVMAVKGKGDSWVSLGKREITVDSAADESCWP